MGGKKIYLEKQDGGWDKPGHPFSLCLPYVFKKDGERMVVVVVGENDQFLRMVGKGGCYGAEKMKVGGFRRRIEKVVSSWFSAAI